MNYVWEFKMPVEIKMPKWGMMMKEAAIIQWFKKEGDIVKKGEPLLEAEAEKIVNAVEAPVSGRLVKIIAKEGEIYPVGATLGLIEPEGD
jgi:pyruvate/2-oxoglutarate dehydrogenase complex dihydrolipoamide acyltransferase (E2) component